MYVQMLERSVAELKGEEAAPELRTTLSLGMDVRIPPEYIPSENLRLRTYKRISSVASEAERQDVQKELKDRFGGLPKAVENLLEFAVLKSMCERLRIASVERQGMKIALRFHPETNLEPAAVVKVVRSRKGIKLDPSGVLWMEVQRGEPVTAALRQVLFGLSGARES
jgi:transcription-repair coupling factor (superfamily II helicase)